MTAAATGAAQAAPPHVGRGKAHGAITILNATATGVGCSLAVEGGVEATWEWTDAPGLGFTATVAGGPAALDDRLVRAVEAHVRRAHPGLPPGARVATQSRFPPSRGLKTSSSAAAALLAAATSAAGSPLAGDELVNAAVDVSLAAGATLTGAYDDQVAVVRGGCHETDNAERRLLASVGVPPWNVAVWVPEAHITKGQVRALDATVLADQANPLRVLVNRGRLLEALTRNGALFARFYQEAGLPIDPRPVEVAVREGALAAGLSGTGPAVAALFRRRVALTPVPGGRWEWTRVAEAAPRAAGAPGGGGR